MKKYLITGSIIFAAILFYIAGPGCPLQAFFGISCPGCGMTRAYFQLLQGNLRNAFFYHPGFGLVPIGGILLLLQRKLPQKIFQIGMWGVIVMFLLIYIFRAVHHDPVLVFDIREGEIYRILSRINDFLQGVRMSCSLS